MKQRDEQTAKYMITEEPDWDKKNRFYVYVRKQTYQPGILFGSYKPEWKQIERFDTREQAEKYISDSLEYQEAKNNPKVIGYY